MKISIIMPLIELNDHAYRSIHSINLVREGTGNNDIELIIVCPKPLKTEIEENIQGVDEICIDEKKGIYEAMNIGIKHAKGDYFYFIGIDDILLLNLKEVLELTVDNPKVILFNNFWGTKGVYKNLKNRYLLISNNWCHQGVIYRKDLFEKYGNYNPKYRTQADHFFNIKIRSQLNKNQILKSKKILSWYSAGGFSTKTIDHKFHEEFPDILNTYYGSTIKNLLILKRKVNGFI